MNNINSNPPPIIPKVPSALCSECGRVFPLDDLIQLSGCWVCAHCKPVLLQKISEGVTPSSAGVGMWRMDKKLVARLGAGFPDRCVKCNAPANGFRSKRVLHWHHPAYYLLLIINFLIYIVIALVIRKKAIFNVGLCLQHQLKRRNALIVGWCGAIGGLSLIVAAVIIGVLSSNEGTLPIIIGTVGAVCLIASAIYGILRGTVVSALKITKENAWIKGVHHDFLADLPEWPGGR